MDDLNRFANRLRFSFAHEVGHLTLHKQLVSLFDFDTPVEYLAFVNGLPEQEYRWIEGQANEFAGCLLVPRDRLKVEIEKACATLKDRGLDYLLEEQSDMVGSTLSPFMRRVFGVSDEVIDIRIQKEGLWPPS
jgi:Zn-dependent peptidase ImmA (M78 family)